MEAFVAPEQLPDGRQALCFQCEGVLSRDLDALLIGRTLTAYTLFTNQSLQESWNLGFIFDDALMLSFSAACTQTHGWREAGSLSLSLSRLGEVQMVPGPNHQRVRLELPFHVVAVEKLVFVDGGILVESGLILKGLDEQEVVVAAGVSPGSVSVLAPFSDSHRFNPEVPLANCHRRSCIA